MIPRILTLLLVLSPLAAAEETSWQPLRSPSAQATTYLQTNWNRFSENYHPTYVLDDDPRTAWVEGMDGNGEGSVLTLPLSTVPSARAVRVRIRNGYQKSAGLLTANAAPERVRLRVWSARGGISGEVEVTLLREMGWQEVVIPLNGGGVGQVDLEVLSVHEGSRYRDTCISDVMVDVDSDSLYSAQAEAGRLHQANTWIAERVAAAQYFAGQPEDYPFVMGWYPYVDDTVDAAVAEQLITAERARMEALRASPIRYDVAHTRRMEVSDGSREFENVFQHFVPENLAWFETEREQITHEQDYAEWEDDDRFLVREEWRSSERVEWADETKSTPRRVHLNVRSVEFGRGTYRSDVHYLLTYNAAGRVGTVYTHDVGNDEMDLSATTESVYRITYDGNGTISGWTRTRRVAGADYYAMQAADDWNTVIPKVEFHRATARAQR